MIDYLHHVCIQTPCYEASKIFYTRILGFELVKESPDFHTRAYNSWLKLDNFMIELQTPKAKNEFIPWSDQNAGPVHLGFVCKDIDVAYQKICALGHTAFKIKNGNLIYTVEGGKLLKVLAPEGTQIELREMCDI